jgi:hypothetical protein
MSSEDCCRCLWVREREKEREMLCLCGARERKRGERERGERERIFYFLFYDYNNSVRRKTLSIIYRYHYSGALYISSILLFKESYKEFVVRHFL